MVVRIGVMVYKRHGSSWSAGDSIAAPCLRARASPRLQRMPRIHKKNMLITAYLFILIHLSHFNTCEQNYVPNMRYLGQNMLYCLFMKMFVTQSCDNIWNHFMELMISQGIASDNFSPRKFAYFPLDFC